MGEFFEYQSRRAAACSLFAALLLGACGGGGNEADQAGAGNMSARLAAPAGTESAQAAGALENAGMLTVRARGTPAGGVGPEVQVRVGGQVVGSFRVDATEFADYSVSAAGLAPGVWVDIVYTNDTQAGSGDRNLFVAYVTDGQSIVLPNAAGAVIDRGSGAAAFDGLDRLPGQGEIYWNAALRLPWPAASAAPGGAGTVALPDSNQARAAAKFLMQASFGPTPASLAQLGGGSFPAWLDAQMALPYAPDFTNAVQAKYDRGAAWRPGGASYSPAFVGNQFWKLAATAPDQLRKRVAFALHQIFVVSQADSNLWGHARAYAAYMDLLNRHAFGNYRELLEDMARSPAMGIYLSHMRNRKGDPATGRLPDENFAREIMQLFSIGLHELNADGTPKLDGKGQPIETYGNADVMALADVFTGWSWGFPDSELSEANFRGGNPVYTAAADRKIDLQPMKAYPGQHSTLEKRLFAGKPWETVLSAGGTAEGDMKKALDVLFNHPNVGPFIGRQLIQRLVKSDPSPAYVARVAAAFANNGKGVRGDLKAVVRAVLLDAEARNAAAPGKLREPVLRVAHWMRALGARSASGDFALAWELDNLGQRVLQPATVFNHFRPGYVPPNSWFAAAGSPAPEIQILDEGTVAAWVNTSEAMAGSGLGWTASGADVSVDHAALGALTAGGDLQPLLDHLNVLLLGGGMSAQLRQAIVNTLAGINGSDKALVLANRARAAVFLVLASPEFMVQP